MKLFAFGPIALAIFLIFGLAYPQAEAVQQTRGPSVTSAQEEVPEWLKSAVQEKDERKSDNVLLTLLEVGNLMMTGIGFLAVVFKGGKYVEKVDRNEADIENLWKVVGRMRGEGHEK